MVTVIAKANPQKFEVLARAAVLPRTQCWTSPVLANGRLYTRNAAGNFVCVDVSGKQIWRMGFSPCRQCVWAGQSSMG